MIFVLVLIFILISFSIPANPALAGELGWTRLNTPANGVAGEWQLALGSDLKCLTSAPDGALYCGADPESTPYRLFKSTDQGWTWSYLGRVEESVLAVAVHPSDPQQVYYAAAELVYGSSDGGNNFSLIADSPGAAGTDGRLITCLAVSDSGLLAAGVSDPSPDGRGGIYLWDENTPDNWQAAGLGDFDAAAVAFIPLSPDHTLLVGVGHDNEQAVIAGREIGTAQPAAQIQVPGPAPHSAGIAWAENSGSSTPDAAALYLSFDTGQGAGGVYRLDPADNWTLSGLMTGLDIGALAAVRQDGQTLLLAGAADSNRVYYSPDAGKAWTESQQPPSGDYISGLLWIAGPDAAENCLAVTGGAESAFSISPDYGLNWRQRALIDSRFAPILDLAISPDYPADGTLFALTGITRFSLWKSTDRGERWERYFCGRADGLEIPERLLLSPAFNANHRVLLAGSRDGVPGVWQSCDRGFTFDFYPSVDNLSGAPAPVDCWVITPDEVLFVGSFDGSGSRVYRTAPGSLEYIDQARVGNTVLYSLAVSPAYPSDQALLAGNIAGGIYLSIDNGQVFEALPYESVAPPFNGRVSPAFDPDYALNHRLYAAADGTSDDGGLYRFDLDSSLHWEALDSPLTEGSGTDCLAFSARGGLYVLNSRPFASTGSGGGIERSLDSDTAVPLFEVLADGLEDGQTLKGLYLNNDCLWTIDTRNGAVLAFQDCLAAGTELVAPADNATGLTVEEITLQWTAVGGALTYRWQVGPDPLFQSLLREGEVSINRVTPGGMEIDQVYYWRVQPCGAGLSGAWSPVWRFDTLDTGSDPIAAPRLSLPRTGATTTVRPVFEWSACEGAERYELLVSRYDNYTQPVVDKNGSNACLTNVWACDFDLEYAAVYYWKVRAAAGELFSDWSAGEVFITEAEPVQGPQLESPKPASPITSSSAAVQPVFRWSSVDNADSYQLLVSTADNFTPLVIDQVCYANSWKCDRTLEYRTAYYWKVRALQTDLYSDWSDVYVFTTKAPSSGSGGGGSGGSEPDPTPTASPAAAPEPVVETGPDSVTPGDSSPSDPDPAVSPTASGNSPPDAPAVTEAPADPVSAGARDAPAGTPAGVDSHTPTAPPTAGAVGAAALAENSLPQRDYRLLLGLIAGGLIAAGAVLTLVLIRIRRARP